MATCPQTASNMQIRTIVSTGYILWHCVSTYLGATGCSRGRERKGMGMRGLFFFFQNLVCISTHPRISSTIFFFFLKVRRVYEGSDLLSGPYRVYGKQIKREDGSGT